MKWVGRILALLVFAGFLLVVAAFTALLWLNIPEVTAGMAAKAVCSAHFVSGRTESAEELMTKDVSPASPAFLLVSSSIDDSEKSVTAKFLGVFSRRASLLDQRGCVLDAQPQPDAVAFTAAPLRPAPWPEGDAAVPVAQWGTGVDSAGLQQAVQQAFVGAGDPDAANTRAVAVVQGGRLLVAQESTDIPQNVALHGWSASKTVAAMLFYKRAQEVGLAITIADLLFMRDGLDNNEGYGPGGSVLQMLYAEPDMASWAASHPVAHPAGTHWQYLSATAVLLSEVTRGQFDTDEEYWAYSKKALFDPIGMTSATLETDTSGTWVGSSYQWASVRDWARLGQVMLKDGDWNGTQVLPKGWLALASTPAMPSGEGHGYGAQTWLPGDPIGGECKAYPGVPADTLAMDGHWGQRVVMVPSRDAVIVRLGWTFTSSQFDGCRLVSDILAALPK